ncbi:ATP-binding protein [Nitrobacter hamburgensis]|uniref:ATP-binding protein n=1 Tax=Nitrobacter hamburgensis TaxID=912 RepID=UPI0018DD10A7|nr:ATP-binding protein [Nitrobacter hamburgensis]
MENILTSPLVQGKLDAIRGIFVKHTKVEEARQMLLLSVAFARRLRENSSTYLIGWSRCGKSETIKRLLQEQTGQPISKKRIQLLHGNGKRFLYVDLMGGSTPRILARQINFNIFNDRKSLRLGEEEGTGALIENLNDLKVDGIILDEAQNLAEDGVKKLARFILSIENECSAPLFVVGPPSLVKMMTKVDAMSQRSGGIKMLPPFGFADDEQREIHAAFVAAFSDELPFESNWFRDNEYDHHMLRATFYAQRGRPGRHSLLVEAAVPHAFIRTGGAEPKELMKEDIAAGFDRVFINQEIMHGRNPFRSEDYLRLPQFPLSVEQEKSSD